MLTFETSAVQGMAGITEKNWVWGKFKCKALIVSPKSLPFEKVTHKVSTLDAHLRTKAMVTGALLVSLVMVVVSIN